MDTITNQIAHLEGLEMDIAELGREADVAFLDGDYTILDECAEAQELLQAEADALQTTLDISIAIYFAKEETPNATDYFQSRL